MLLTACLCENPFYNEHFFASGKAITFKRNIEFFYHFLFKYLMESASSMLSVVVYFVYEILVSGFPFSCCAMCQTQGTQSLSLKSLLHLCPAPPRPQHDCCPGVLTTQRFTRGTKVVLRGALDILKWCAELGVCTFQ